LDADIDNDQLCTDFLVSNKEVNAVQQIKLFPNPASEQVQLVLPAPAPSNTNFSLHDALGREVHRTALPAGQQQVTIYLSALPPGLYFWSVVGEGRAVGHKGTSSGKLVISK
jgi:hypothetical protein